MGCPAFSRSLPIVIYWFWCFSVISKYSVPLQKTIKSVLCNHWFSMDSFYNIASPETIFQDTAHCEHTEIMQMTNLAKKEQNERFSHRLLFNVGWSFLDSSKARRMQKKSSFFPCNKIGQLRSLGVLSHGSENHATAKQGHEFGTCQKHHFWRCIPLFSAPWVSGWWSWTFRGSFYGRKKVVRLIVVNQHGS